MNGADYRIPWAPLDFATGLNGIRDQLNKNEDDRRADEYVKIQRENAAINRARESAEEHRRRIEFEAKQADLKRQHDIEAIQALPMLGEAARRSLGYGNAMGKPYGISFAQKPDGDAPSIAGTDLFGAAGNALGRFAEDTLAGNTPPGDHRDVPAPSPNMAFVDQTEDGRADLMLPGREGTVNVPSRGGLHPMQEGESLPIEGPEYRPEALGMAPAAPQAPAVEEPMSPVEAEMRKLEARPQRSQRLVASMGGQEFDVPADSGKTGFGPEYDAYYQSLVSQGIDRKQAIQIVAAEHKADRGQSAIADRTAAAIEARRAEAERSRPDVDKQDEWRRLQREQSEKNARINANGRVAASDPGSKAESATDRAMGLLRQQGSAYRQTTQYNKLIAAGKTVRSIASNLASDVPLAHSDAQIAVARFFRQAQPTEGEMHLLYDKLGGWADKFDQFKAKVMTGDLSPEQLRQLREAAKLVNHENEIDKENAVKTGRYMYGPGSGFENYPDAAQAAFNAHMQELGIDPNTLPPLYSTEGGAKIGSFQRPQVKPKTGGRKAHPSASQPGETRMGPGGKMYYKAGPNNWQPVPEGGVPR